ncbi:hypothetical protein V6Z88_004897 [Aspergillus fumigatus]
MDFGANGESTGLAETSEPARKSLMYQGYADNTRAGRTSASVDLLRCLSSADFSLAFRTPLPDAQKVIPTSTYEQGCLPYWSDCARHRLYHCEIVGYQPVSDKRPI